MSIRDLFKERLSLSGWIKDLMFGGIGAVGITMTYQLFEVIKQRPDLLVKWGPNFVLWLLGITVIGIIVNRLVDALIGSVDRLADGQERQIEISTRNADAQHEIASAQRELAAAQREAAQKSNAQLDEIQTGVGYNQVQNERILQQLGENRTQMNRIEAHLGIVPVAQGEKTT